MAVNYFIGWAQEDLEAELRKAQEDLAAGKTVSDASSGDVSKREQISHSIEVRIRLILRALNKLNPTAYPIDQITAITTFKVSFSSAGRP